MAIAENYWKLARRRVKEAEQLAAELGRQGGLDMPSPTAGGYTVFEDGVKRRATEEEVEKLRHDWERSPRSAEVSPVG
jgi:hypothetical protein